MITNNSRNSRAGASTSTASAASTSSAPRSPATPPASARRARAAVACSSAPPSHFSAPVRQRGGEHRRVHDLGRQCGERWRYVALQRRAGPRVQLNDLRKHRLAGWRRCHRPLRQWALPHAGHDHGQHGVVRRRRLFRRGQRPGGGQPCATRARRVVRRKDERPHGDSKNAAVRSLRAQRRRAQGGVFEVGATSTILSANSGEDVGGVPATAHSNHSLLGTNGAVTTVDDRGGTIRSSTPTLGPLQDNGGPTQTHELLAGSAAIDAGLMPVPTFTGNEFDQRGDGFAGGERHGRHRCLRGPARSCGSDRDHAEVHRLSRAPSSVSRSRSRRFGLPLTTDAPNDASPAARRPHASPRGCSRPRPASPSTPPPELPDRASPAGVPHPARSDHRTARRHARRYLAITPPPRDSPSSAGPNLSIHGQRVMSRTGSGRAHRRAE